MNGKYYRVIDKLEYSKLLAGETLFPIHNHSTHCNTFPRGSMGIYLYYTADTLEGFFYNYIPGEYIVVLDIPDSRIKGTGCGTYYSSIPDEDGYCGMVSVNEALAESYSMKDVKQVYRIAEDCFDMDDFYSLKDKHI